MRRCQQDDVPFVRRLFELRLKREEGYDPEAAETWFRNAVLPNPVFWLAMRTDDAFMISGIKFLPYQPTKPRVFVMTVCCDVGKVWQSMPLLRASQEWAQERKATSWEWESDTLFEIGGLARRLGAVTREPRYVINLEN